MRVQVPSPAPPPPYRLHYMDGFPSGQREQTVNLPSQTSMVRIHPHPPRVPPSAGMAELADAQDSGSCEGFLHAGSSPVSRTKHGSGQRWPLLCFHRVRQGNVLLYAIGMIGSCFTPAGSRPARRYMPALPAGTAQLPIGQTGGQSNDVHIKVEWRGAYHDIRGRNGLDSVRSQK